MQGNRFFGSCSAGFTQLDGAFRRSLTGDHTSQMESSISALTTTYRATYRHVTHRPPLPSFTINNRCKLITLCFLFWLVYVLQTVTYTFTMFAVNYCIPLLIILFCYFHIVRAVSLREQNLRRQVDKMDAVSLRTDSAANASNMDIHFAKVNLINVTMWVALWTPYVVVVLHGALGQRDMITPLVSTLTFLTARCIAVVNPIVYAFSHTKYRLVSAA